MFGQNRDLPGVVTALLLNGPEKAQEETAAALWELVINGK